MERSLINAIAYGKRRAEKIYTSFNELVEDAQYEYYLRDDEVVILREKLKAYCIKHHCRNISNVQ